MSVVMSAKAIHGLSPGGTAGTLRGTGSGQSLERAGGARPGEAETLSTHHQSTILGSHREAQPMMV